MIDTAKIDWEKMGGMIPVIVQDAATGLVLMLGYMNDEALRETLARKRVVFFSRSKNRLWEKGETSGHTLNLVDLSMDCDGDALLVLANPAGPTCHRGTESCFDGAAGFGFLGALQDVITQRLLAGGEGSYVASLAARGLPRMAQKVGEEGVETALAAICEPDDKFKGEAADLLFHLMVLLRAKNITLGDIAGVLQERHK